MKDAAVDDPGVDDAAVDDPGMEHAAVGDPGVEVGGVEGAAVEGAAVGDQTEVPAHGAGLRAVITDWGGVLTNSIPDTVGAWLEADGIDRARYSTVMRSWLKHAYSGDPGANPIHRLERGEGDPAEFERELAAQLVRTDGGQVQAAGLLSRMFAGSLAIPQMYDLMRSLRRAGIRTCLLSNSWGNNDYPRDVFPDLFDAWVISAEVGMRKPEERIFLLAAERLGLPPDQCVFIDDIQANVDAATALGMAGVLHRTPLATTAHLAALLNLPLT
jgi:putative hydrolase of the HAD superfamily